MESIEVKSENNNTTI